MTLNLWATRKSSPQVLLVTFPAEAAEAAAGGGVGGSAAPARGLVVHPPAAQPDGKKAGPSKAKKARRSSKTGPVQATGPQPLLQQLLQQGPGALSDGRQQLLGAVGARWYALPSLSLPRDTVLANLVECANEQASERGEGGGSRGVRRISGGKGVWGVWGGGVGGWRKAKR